MSEETFLQLKKQIQQGNDRGLSFVFEETNRYCVRTLIKKTQCDAADAEDLYMDAIIIFRENILSGKLVTLTNLKTYLFGICWNLWRDLNRARSRWQREQNEIEHQLFLAMEGDGQVWAEDDGSLNRSRIKAIQQGLAQLNEKCRQLLTYVYVEQRSQKEIAELMAFASANVVKVTRHRCYQQWVKQIEQASVQSHGTN